MRRVILTYCMNRVKIRITFKYLAYVLGLEVASSVPGTSAATDVQVMGTRNVTHMLLQT